MKNIFNKNTIIVVILIILLFITFVNYKELLKKYILLNEYKKNPDIDVIEKITSDYNGIVMKPEEMPNVKWPFRNLKDQDKEVQNAVLNFSNKKEFPCKDYVPYNY